jgi:hypothetical protein
MNLVTPQDWKSRIMELGSILLCIVFIFRIADVYGSRSALEGTNSEDTVKKFLPGVWVNQDFFRDLQAGDFKQASTELTPFRSVGFVPEGNKLYCQLEFEFERISNYKKLNVSIKRLNDSVCNIIFNTQSWPVAAFKWTYNTKSRLILLEKGTKRFKFIKAVNDVIKSDPLSLVYNSTLLNGRFILENDKNLVLSDNIYCNKFTIKNFLNFKIVRLGEADYPMKDRHGDFYFSIFFNITANDQFPSTRFAYRKAGDKIYLYDFKPTNREQYFEGVDSVKLKYILVRKE